MTAALPPLPPEAERYLRRLRLGLSSLSPEERGDIVQEIRSHMGERLAAGKSNLLEGFDEPEAYASKFVANYALGGALSRGTSLTLGRALLTGASSGLFTLFIVAPLLALEFLGACLVLLGFLKPVFPARIGAFYSADGAFVALGAYGGDVAQLREALGWWSVPLFFIPGILMIFVCNRALRALARRKLKNSQTVRSLGRVSTD
jgi:uncharacterized membrane protein